MRKLERIAKDFPFILKCINEKKTFKLDEMDQFVRVRRMIQEYIEYSNYGIKSFIKNQKEHGFVYAFQEDAEMTLYRIE